MIANKPTKIDKRADAADSAMYYAYGLGTAYSVTEYGLMIAPRFFKLLHQSKDHLEAMKIFKISSPIIYPFWNFVDTVGVLFDAKKDAQNRDHVSAALNVFSSLQLAAGTLVGIMKTHSDAPMAVGQSMANGICVGSFALCMFFSAAVAAYKESALETDMENIDSNNPTYITDVIERMALRHPGHQTKLEELRKEFLLYRTSHDRKNEIKAQLIEVLSAEQEYQRKAKIIWSVCGIAMTLVTATIFAAASPLVLITMISVSLSCYGRMQLRDEDEKLKAKVNDAMNHKKNDNSLLLSSWGNQSKSDTDSIFVSLPRLQSQQAV